MLSHTGLVPQWRSCHRVFARQWDIRRDLRCYTLHKWTGSDWAGTVKAAAVLSSGLACWYPSAMLARLGARHIVPRAVTFLSPIRPWSENLDLLLTAISAYDVSFVLNAVAPSHFA